MFGKTNRRLEKLEEHRAYKSDYYNLNERYWNLVRDFNALLEHLGLNIEDVPGRREVTKKGGPEKG